LRNTVRQNSLTKFRAIRESVVSYRFKILGVSNILKFAASAESTALQYFYSILQYDADQLRIIAQCSSTDVQPIRRLVRLVQPSKIQLPSL